MKNHVNYKKSCIKCHEDFKTKYFDDKFCGACATKQAEFKHRGFNYFGKNSETQGIQDEKTTS